jgi:hypothetical protein
MTKSIIFDLALRAVGMAIKWIDEQPTREELAKELDERLALIMALRGNADAAHAEWDRMLADRNLPKP